MLKALSVLAASVLIGVSASAEDYERISCEWRKIDGEVPDLSLVVVKPKTCPTTVEVCTGVAVCREVEKSYLQKEFKGRLEEMIGKPVDENKIREVQTYLYCKALDTKTCPTANACTKDDRAIEILDPKDVKVSATDETRDSIEDKKPWYKPKTY